MCDESREKRGDREDRNDITDSDCRDESEYGEHKLNKSCSENSLDSECRVDRINKSKCEC
jgi:hypothetical protein